MVPGRERSRTKHRTGAGGGQCVARGSPCRALPLTVEARGGRRLFRFQAAAMLGTTPVRGKGPLSLGAYWSDGVGVGFSYSPRAGAKSPRDCQGAVPETGQTMKFAPLFPGERGIPARRVRPSGTSGADLFWPPALCPAQKLWGWSEAAQRTAPRQIGASAFTVRCVDEEVFLQRSRAWTGRAATMSSQDRGKAKRWARRSGTGDGAVAGAGPPVDAAGFFNQGAHARPGPHHSRASGPNAIPKGTPRPPSCVFSARGTAFSRVGRARAGGGT